MKPRSSESSTRLMPFGTFSHPYQGPNPVPSLKLPLCSFLTRICHLDTTNPPFRPSPSQPGPFISPACPVATLYICHLQTWTAGDIARASFSLDRGPGRPQYHSNLIFSSTKHWNPAFFLPVNTSSSQLRSGRIMILGPHKVQHADRDFAISILDAIDDGWQPEILIYLYIARLGPESALFTLSPSRPPNGPADSRVNDWGL